MYKDGKVLLTRHDKEGRHYQFYFALVNPGEAEIIERSNVDKAFDGIPRWEGGDNVLVSNFVHKWISKVNTARFSDSKLVFQEKTLGYPEPGLFWNGKCVVPCGFQGLLIEK